MQKYLLRRLLLFIPTLIAITLFSFIILVNAPGNPVERMMTASESTGDVSTQSIAAQEQRTYWTHYFGLDLPVFYFSLHSLAEPDTLFKITDKNERDALNELIAQYGNWNEIQQYHASLLQLEKTLQQLNDDNSNIPVIAPGIFKNDLNHARIETASLKFYSDEKIIRIKLNNLKSFIESHTVLAEARQSVEQVEKNFYMVSQQATKWKNYIPVCSIHPVNQYHRWLIGDGNQNKGMLRGDFGISYLTKQPVSSMIRAKIGWTLFFTLFSVVLAYLISIPVAMKAASKKDSGFDKFSSIILFLLFSLPAFWVATLLLMTLSNPDALALFPASGVMPVTGFPVSSGFIEKIKLTIPYLILPTICYTYSSFAFLSRTLRVSIIEILSSDFIRTARAKGLSERAVLWKHALKNSMLPMITVFTGIFPYMISGSVILESIFTIPGMGSTLYNSIEAQDYPMIVAVFTWTGILTMTGFLVSDILYAAVDPRITFSKSVSQ